MDGLVLEKGIGETEKIVLDAEGWLKKLIEAIQEDLLSPEQIKALLDDPQLFLTEYTEWPVLGIELHKRIVQMFFASMIEMKERKQNTQKVLKETALNHLDDKLADVDNISAVDMSQIFKNLR